MHSFPHPRQTVSLTGHEAPLAALMDAYASGRMPHAWILAGARGIGKATLAYHFARRLLSRAIDAPLPEESAVFRRIAAGSHADLLTLEPLYDEKKEERRQEISVDQARSVASFLSLKSAESDWRVVIVDSADALNTNAANAILKTLEEPGARALLLLIAHNPSRLLPTIRSRCRFLHVPQLNAEEYMQVMRHAAPGMEEKKMRTLGAFSRYAPGVALEFEQYGALEHYTAIVALMGRLPGAPAERIQAFSAQFGGKQAHANWRIMAQAFALFLERLVTQAADEAAPDELSVRRRLLYLRPAPFWVGLWQEAASQFSLAEAAHLDYKTVIIAFFEHLNQQLHPAHAA